jgi:hypothetical protein
MGKLLGDMGKGMWWIWKFITFPFVWVKQKFAKTPASSEEKADVKKEEAVSTSRQASEGHSSWPLYIIFPAIVGAIYALLNMSIGDSLSALFQNVKGALPVLGLLLVGIGAFFLLRKLKENPNKTEEGAKDKKEEKNTKPQQGEKDGEKPWWEKNSSLWLLFWTFYVVGLFTIFAVLAYTATRWIYHNIELEGMRNYEDYRNLVYMALFIPFVANWWTVSNAKKLRAFSKGFAHVLWVTGIVSMFFTAFIFLM